MAQIRQIGLSNYIYKIFSKIIVHRLQPLMDCIISKNQCALIRGRLISDNILLAHELTHHLKTKQKSSSHDMAIKLDISKAFDRLEWPCLTAILYEMEFNESFVDLVKILAIPTTGAQDKYLGLPVIVNKSKKATFEFIIHMIEEKIQSSSLKLLSRAGKAVLIKSVLNAIPAYSMSSFYVSDFICERINKLCTSFWWSSNAGKKSIHWLKWQTLSRSFANEGLDFKDCRAQNLSLLAKQGWRLMTNPISLLSLTLKGKYFPYCSFMDATSAHCSSSSLAMDEYLEAQDPPEAAHFLVETPA
ncbi:hypothetical protein Cni_G23470 [Canna indica]|uniref:Reverse transcriptase domain-containing protein n=1 Tax=Canna indica TaxID=4628 RepID=A0AAQ3KU30_9LILI|nr:hypothetical protein Cni_G23470 [Canna indica]